MGSQAGSIFKKRRSVGVSKKVSRKIMIDGNVYWWFAEEAGANRWSYTWRLTIPFLQIVICIVSFKITKTVVRAYAIWQYHLMYLIGMQHLRPNTSRVNPNRNFR